MADTSSIVTFEGSFAKGRGSPQAQARGRFTIIMATPFHVTTLAQYLAGEFENQEQAMTDPVWFVHLRLWHRPVPLFQADSLTLFAEQANVLTLDRPYRQRLMRLMANPAQPSAIQVQYYSFHRPEQFVGAGRDPQRLQDICLDQIEILSGCRLDVTLTNTLEQSLRFRAESSPARRCCFRYQGQLRYVSLGFEVSSQEFLSYDKGIDPDTGQALWGAMMGAYRYLKQQDFSDELNYAHLS